MVEQLKTNTRKAAYMIAYGIILGAFIVAASETFENFAPLPMTAIWVQMGGLLVGIAMAWTFDESILTFGGVFLSGVIAMIVFTAAVVGTAAIGGNPFLDVMAVYAFQQSFPHLLGIVVFGAVGALVGSVVRSWTDGAL
jgi:hypothetical protein